VDDCDLGNFFSKSPATTIERCTVVNSAGTAIDFSGGSQGDSNLLSGNTVKRSGQANLANSGLFNQIDDTNEFQAGGDVEVW
jgi:hypothetical protein